MGKRQHERYTKRVETEFVYDGRSFKGISSDLSEKGLFLRTRNAAPEGSEISIKLFLPDGNAAHARGVVRRSVKTRSQVVKDGMGLEITEFDDAYADFLKGVVGRDIRATGTS